jgi:iron complex transport system substrate-binding protein
MFPAMISRMARMTAHLPLLAAAIALLIQSGAAAAEAPRRVVSMDVCGDQLLIALAGPTQIAALSPQSINPERSFFAAAAAQYPHDADSVEAVIHHAPDLVLVGPDTPNATRERLGRLGYRLYDVDPVPTIDAATAQVTEIADLLGQPAAGADLGELILSARLQANRPDFGLTALYYEPRGYVPPEANLVTDLFATIGLHNAGPDLVGAPGGFLPLERLIASPPDYLVVADENTSRSNDGGSPLLEHPALARVFPPDVRLGLPENLVSCGGPTLPEALRVLASEFRRVNP